MPEHLWTLITNLGDSAVLIPIACILAVWLALRSWPTALLWSALLAATIAGVAATKVAYMGWGIHLPGMNFTGLSGHSALSMFIWPTLGAALAADRRRLWRWLIPAAGAVLSLLITVSRHAIDVHTPIEALLGV